MDNFIVTEHALTKEASAKDDALKECKDIMNQIYKEDPSYWPEGLNVEGHTSLYMIREASTKKAVGFVGWQKLAKKGYYTIGILPEYRQKGFAKEAVRKMLNKEADSVDTIEAMIVSHNRPSLNLASSLGINIKNASEKRAANLLPWVVGGGLGNAAFFDWVGQGDKNPLKEEYWKDWDSGRTKMTLFNALLGAGGGGLMGRGLGRLAAGKNGAGEIASGASMLALSPVKDWILRSLPAAEKVPAAIDNLSKPSGIHGLISSMPNAAKMGLLGAGGLGAAGLAYGGYKGIKAINDLAKAEKARAGGQLEVILPTHDPKRKGKETRMLMPFEESGLSESQKALLERDLRRQISQETRERTEHSRAKKKKQMSSSLNLPASGGSLNNINNLLTTIYGGK